MNRFYPQRNSYLQPKYVRFLAGFWMYLLALYLLSLWS